MKKTKQNKKTEAEHLHTIKKIVMCVHISEYSATKKPLIAPLLINEK